MATTNYQITGCHAHCVGRIARRIEYRLASGRVKAHQLRDSIVVVLANNGAARLVIQLYRKTLGCYISTGGSDGYVDVQFVMALFPKSTIKPQLPQPQVTVTLGAF
ncbi:hypothetical protein ACK302_09915 [Aeromonas caviae]